MSDPELLKEVFLEFSGETVGSWDDPRLAHLADTLKLVDGTLLPALPRMHWAFWLDDQNAPPSSTSPSRSCARPPATR